MEKTQGIKDINYITLNERMNYWGEYSDEKFFLKLSINEPIEEWITVLSKNPNNEPEIQEYLTKKKAYLDKKLKLRLGKWFSLQKAGRKMLCDHEEILFNMSEDTIHGVNAAKFNARRHAVYSRGKKRSEIKKLAKRLTGRSIENVSMFYYNYGNGAHLRVVRINFPYPTRLEITNYYNNKGEKIESNIGINNGSRAVWRIENDRENTSWFDNNCNFKHAQIMERDSHKRLLEIQYLDKNGDIENTVQANPRIMSLQEIYGDCTHSNELLKLFTKINKIKQVIVTVADSGIFYNNRNLAFRIRRPNGKVLKQLERLRENKQQAESKLEKMSEAEKQNYGDELLAKIASLSEDTKKIEERAGYTGIGLDTVDNDKRPNDIIVDYRTGVDFHGTEVAGIAVAGDASITAFPIRFDSDSTSEEEYAAFHHACNEGSELSNASWNFDSTDNKGFGKAMTDCEDMTFVVAAGNEGIDVDSPSSDKKFSEHSNMIVVTAGDYFGELADFSNVGKNSVDVIAPGVLIIVSSRNNSRNLMDGTSVAVPFVTNIIAHMKVINPALKPEEIIKIIMETVDKKPELKGKVKSGGIVNRERALQGARESLNK